MEILHIFNFIITHFVQNNITHVTIANCWSVEDKISFSNLAQQNLMSWQYYNINDMTEIKKTSSMVNRDRYNVKPKVCSNNYLPQIGIILDFDCNGSYDVIKIANLTPYCFSGNYKWAIFSQSDTFDYFFDIFKDVSLFVDVNLNFMQFLNDTIKIYDVYNNGQLKGGKLNITLESIAVLLDNKFNIHKTDLLLRSKYNNRQLLNDLTLRMGTVIVSKEYLKSKETIIDYLKSSNNTHVEPFSRLGYKYEKLLQDIFQYQIEIIVYDKWSTNGSSGGAFGPIVDGRDDLSGVLFTLYPGRMAKAHFLIQLGEFRSVFFFRTPHNENIASGVFLKPFSKLVWFTILATIFVVSLILFKMFAYEKKIFKNFHIIPSYITLFLNSLAVLCQQDSHFIPKTTGGRIALITFIICSYILNQYYASVIISSLLSTPLKTHIKTLEQLADSRLEVGFEPIVYIYEFLKSNTSSVKYFTNKRVNIQNPNPAQFPDVELGIKHVQLGGYAYHSEATTAVRMIEKLFTAEEICDLNEVPLRGDFPASIPINKKSPFIEIRRQKYLLLLESGLIHKHRKKWMRSRVHCFSKSNVGTVGLEYAAPLMLLLLFGMGTSVLLLILEVIQFHFCRRFKNKLQSTFLN